MATSPTQLEQAFLDDIVAHPDDPSLWLILADWLDERDDPRAELVRLTWQLQHEPDHADFAPRQTRLQELLASGMQPVRPRRTLASIEFAWIPPGTFLMGSPEEEAERSNDEFLHRVTLSDPFWMSVTLVTHDQWRTVMGTDAVFLARPGEVLPDATIPSVPVEGYSWDNAVAFCTRLGTTLGQRALLPTEAQWEFACRAGTTTPFHFGSVLNGTQANCNGTVPYGTKEPGPFLARRTPAGLATYPCNAWGLRDLHGNLWEWCADWSGVYPVSAVTDPPGPVSGAYRVLRGGAWNSLPRYCRAAFRERAERNRYHGFRVIVPARADAQHPR